ncbi:putative fuscose transport/metabolism protein [Escherichia coli]|uniref:Putative fuscose transport/metabolism protein n=1 Tax=Escherichia coli TaxID=562 RepID=A0A484YVR4_ECOLX|nr:putative fuscose transport/metabolism protein [Escherichia coli]
MLKTISPLISPELLKVLAEMGMEMKLFFPMLTFPPIRWDRR